MLQLDGNPQAKHLQRDLFYVDGKYGLYDQNFNLLKKYSNMQQFLDDYKNTDMRVNFQIK